MSFSDFGDEQAPEPIDRPQPADLAGMLVSGNGFLVLAFGVLLMLTPVGDRQEVDAPDFGTLESMGIAAIGLVLIVAAMWRRDGVFASLPMAAVGLLAAVACLAVVEAGWMAVFPTLALLALINRPFPRTAP